MLHSSERRFSTGVPVSNLTEAETEKLLRMEGVLHERIIGQDEAVTALSKAIRRSRSGLKDPKRPAGSFIFLGPSFLCDLKKLFKDIRVHRLREISHEIDRLQENMLGISRRISGQVNDLQLREFLIQLIGIIDSLLPLFRLRNFCIIFMADIHDQDIRSFSIFKSIPHMPDILVSFDTLHLRNLSQHIFNDIQHFRLVIAYRNVHCMFPHVFRFSRFGELFL